MDFRISVSDYWLCNRRFDLSRYIAKARSRQTVDRRGLLCARSVYYLVYVASADDTSDDLYFIDKAIKDEEQNIAELANLAMKSPNNRDNYEAAISDCTDRIKVLRERREEILRQLNFNEAAKAEIERIERYLTEDRAVFTEFDDCTVRRLVNSISVSKDMELTIYLKGGYEVKEKYLPLKNTA